VVSRTTRPIIRCSHEWFDERTSLIGVIGLDLSLPGILCAITTNKESWLAFVKFAENVMRAKEEAERAREAAIVSPDMLDPG